MVELAFNVTTMCVDPISGRLFVGVSHQGKVALLPSARAILAAGGSVAWRWDILLTEAYDIYGLAFDPIKRRLSASTRIGSLDISGPIQMGLHEVELPDKAFRCSESVDGDATHDVLTCEEARFDTELDAPHALCLENRSSLLFACEEDGVTALDEGRTVDHFSSPSLALGGPRGIAFHNRRRILYVAGARHIQAFEVKTIGFRFSISLLADCAAVAQSQTEEDWRTWPVGFNEGLRVRLTCDDANNIASANYDTWMLRAGDVLSRNLDSREVSEFPFQAELAPLYAFALKSSRHVRLAAKLLRRCPLWFDDYARVDNEALLHSRHMLRSFDRGAIWAVTGAALLALRLGSALREPARQALRATRARGSVWANELLGRNLLLSLDRAEQEQGFRLLIAIARVRLVLVALLAELLSR